jgi:anthranilate/para-aminobenzoate synthase component II
MIVLIDNYDSFTFNLVHYLGELGAEPVVAPQRQEPSAAVVATDPRCDRARRRTPDDAGICLELIEQAAARDSGVLSAWATRRSARRSAAVVRAPVPVHGKLRR